MDTMISLGPWLWAAYALGMVLVVFLVYRRADEGRSVVRTRRALIAAAIALGIFALLFVVLPEAAMRGALPGTYEASICDESPGSGCAACTASAEQFGEDSSHCYEGRVSDSALGLAALGPVSRGRALSEASRRGLLP